MYMNVYSVLAAWIYLIFRLRGLYYNVKNALLFNTCYNNYVFMALLLKPVYVFRITCKSGLFFVTTKIAQCSRSNML